MSAMSARKEQEVAFRPQGQMRMLQRAFSTKSKCFAGRILQNRYQELDFFRGAAT
jgi:hypothetical protein